MTKLNLLLVLFFSTPLLFFSTACFSEFFIFFPRFQKNSTKKQLLRGSVYYRGQLVDQVALTSGRRAAVELLEPSRQVWRQVASSFCFWSILEFFLGHFFSHSGRGAENVLLFLWFLRFLWPFSKKSPVFSCKLSQFFAEFLWKYIITFFCDMEKLIKWKLF